MGDAGWWTPVCHPQTMRTESTAALRQTSRRRRGLFLGDKPMRKIPCVFRLNFVGDKVVKTSEGFLVTR